MSTRTIVSLVVIIIVVILGYFALRLPATPAISHAAFSCNGCNVLVIGVDTLRADHVHALGYSLDTTPTLDMLASKGFIFSDAIAPASWTVPSFMSIMTGEYPSVHKVVNKFTVFTPKQQTLSNLAQLSPGTVTLADQFKAAGYATGGFTGDAGVSGKFGYSQGFDTYTDEKTFGGFDNSAGHALSWLDSLRKGQKFFMFFHGYDLHGQFNLATSSRTFVPADYKGPFIGSSSEEAKLREQQLVKPISLTPADVAFWKGLYDSKILSADTELATFLGELDKRGLLANTMIVVVADHGEEYYEHGGIDHGHTLYDELIHVPLIIDIPGTAGGQTVPGQVSTMDLGPAILKIAGVNPTAAYNAQTAGRPDLTTYLKDPSTAGYSVYSETDYRDFTHKRAIRTADGWKYILTLETNKEELYNLSTDPGEKTNLIAVAADAAKAEELRTALRTHLTQDLHMDLTKSITTGCLPVYQGECQ